MYKHRYLHTYMMMNKDLLQESSNNIFHEQINYENHSTLLTFVKKNKKKERAYDHVIKN